jgi:hypothetical protein
MTFHVEGITAAERDAIATELAEKGGSRIAFACIPAGIIVIERIDQGTDERAASSNEAMVRARIGSKAMSIDDRPMAELEEECQNARNQ